MDTLLVIISLCTVAAQQALADGRDWRPCLAMPELLRKRHPHAQMILAQLHDDRRELALVRAMPSTPEQEPYLCPHLWLVVPVSDLQKFKAELAIALRDLHAEFEEISRDDELLDTLRGNPDTLPDLDDDDDDGGNDDGDDDDDDGRTDQPV